MQQFIWLILRGLPPEVWSRRIKARKQIIGRSSECAIRLFDDKVSRQHAKIWERGGVAFIRDLKSSNGTLAARQRGDRCTLPTGKTLRIGDVTFQVITSQGTVQSDTFGCVTSTTIKYEIPLGVINTNFGDLSDGQRQVLRRLVQGASEKEAAASLNLSYHTVHAHVKQIYRQLGVRSRGELIALCLSPPEIDSVDTAESLPQR